MANFIGVVNRAKKAVIKGSGDAQPQAGVAGEPTLKALEDQLHALQAKKAQQTGGGDVPPTKKSIYVRPAGGEEAVRIKYFSDLAKRKESAYAKLDSLREADPNASKVLENQFTGKSWHYSGSAEFDQFDPWKLYGESFDTAGAHSGTMRAAAERAKDKNYLKVGDVYETIVDTHEKGRGRSTVGGAGSRQHVLNLRYREDKPFTRPNGQPWTESDLRTELNKVIRSDEFFDWLQDSGYGDAIVESMASRDYGVGKMYKARRGMDLRDLSPSQKEEFAFELNHGYGPVVGQFLAEKKGFTHIPYWNAVEDAGSLSTIILDPARNARVADAAFMAEVGGLKSAVAGTGGAAAVAAAAQKGAEEGTKPRGNEPRGNEPQLKYQLKLPKGYKGGI